MPISQAAKYRNVWLALILAALTGVAPAYVWAADDGLPPVYVRHQYDTEWDPLLTGYFPEDWAFLKPQLSKKAHWNFSVKDSEIMYTVYERSCLREVLRYAIEILKYASYDDPVEAHPWIADSDWREVSVESAKEILGDIGAPAVPGLWACLASDIRNDTPARKEAYKAARAAEEQRRTVKAEIDAHIAACLPHFAGRYAWIGEPNEKARTVGAWVALLKSNNLGSMPEQTASTKRFNADADKIRAALMRSGGHETEEVKRATKAILDPLLANDGAKKFVTDDEAEKKALLARRYTVKCRDGKVHLMLPHQFYQSALSADPYLHFGQVETEMESAAKSDENARKDEKFQALVVKFRKAFEALEKARKSIPDEMSVESLIFFPDDDTTAGTFKSVEVIDRGLESKLVKIKTTNDTTQLVPMIPSADYRANLIAAFERIGAPALPVVRKHIADRNPEVAAAARDLIARIENKHAAPKACDLRGIECQQQRRARLALTVWDATDPAPGSAVAAAAKKELLKSGVSAVDDILFIMSINAMGLKTPCGRALELISGRTFGDDLSKWQEWNVKRKR